MRKTKEIIHTAIQDGVDFNLDVAAKLPLADFLEQNAHQYPDMTDEQRKASLTSVHEKAMAKVHPPKSESNGNASGNASGAGSAKRGQGTGTGGTADGGNSGGTQ